MKIYPELEGKWVLISGASSGIGAELAKIFFEQGCNLVIVARRKDRLTKLANELTAGKSKQKVEVINQDLAVIGGPEAVFLSCKTKKLPIEILVNNAGFGDFDNFIEADQSKLEEMIDLNVRSLTSMTKLFLPLMVEQGYGRILNVGSLAGFLPGPRMAVYYASKAYVHSFSEALRYELRKTGVSVTALSPGTVVTEFARVAGQSETLNKAKAIAAVAVEKVALYGFIRLMKKKKYAIPGLKTRLLMALMKIIPRSIKLFFIDQLQERS